MGEGGGGEMSDKHRWGRTKSHLILRREEKEQEEWRRGTRRGDMSGPRCEDEALLCRDRADLSAQSGRRR